MSLEQTSPTEAQPTPPPIHGGDLPADRFLDREISWLDFNQRVLELAEDNTLPPLERAKFLAIFASNLDEFFMVRVAGLKRRIATGIAVRAASGLTPREVLENIWVRAHALQREHAIVFHAEVLPALSAHGIELLRWAELADAERDATEPFFDRQVFPVLTPLAVDPSHPFPYISGLSLNLAVVVRNPITGTELFARVKVPPSLPRFVAVGPQRFVPLEDIIAAHLNDLFPGMQILEHHAFRV
ncbi:MAG: RNA degradosome polyphosphate kinase, partial [Actinomycetes bacterium]